MTDRYGVIGHPISHSKSPVIHAQFARQTRQDLTYEAIDIEPADLATTLDSLIHEGFKGLNVTVPHKNAVVDLMDELSDRARLAAAVNTITVKPGSKLVGDNTDGIGLVRDLQRNLKFELQDADILILGAGGATRGIVPSLLEAGARGVVVANRTLQRAIEIADEFGDRGAKLGDVDACEFADLEDGQFDLIINATSAGLGGEVPPFPASIVLPDNVCYDLSYAMKPTPFVAWAKAQGATRAYQGWGMLVEQAAASFRIWRDVKPDTKPILANLPT
ncbi:MAG: shikimate dehydrogenase [Gammaproteobacteria bacterium]|nr:shikimate dehydrogenase [Gammaproteobacteria bacterium]NND37496.1 shikimate dehydrogenase [Gammaproteobacteria bacterium]